MTRVRRTEAVGRFVVSFALGVVVSDLAGGSCWLRGKNERKKNK